MSKKKKPRISPDEYREILKNVELEDISLIKSEFIKNDENFPARIDLNYKHKVTRKILGNRLVVYFNYSLIGKNEIENVEGVQIKLTFRLEYLLNNDVEISDSFFDIFQSITISHSIWPYVREYIQNITSRMNIPPLTLPLMKKL